MASFRQTVALAITDFRHHGFDSTARLERWTKALRKALEAETGDPVKQRLLLERSLRAIYTRLVDNGGVLRGLRMTGPRSFSISIVLPRLRAELDRRIEASAMLIKNNHDEMVESTLRRFAGWASAQPAGGSADPQVRETAEKLKKSFGALPYAERRVLIDQGHKLTSNITAVVAEGGGAIAAKWFSHWRQKGYNYREDHKERDGEVYLIRGSWAQEKGLVKSGPAGYSDEITQPGEEVNCRCKFEYIFAVSKLPENMLTAKGKMELQRVRGVLRRAA